MWCKLCLYRMNIWWITIVFKWFQIVFKMPTRWQKKSPNWSLLPRIKFKLAKFDETNHLLTQEKYVTSGSWFKLKYHVVVAMYGTDKLQFDLLARDHCYLGGISSWKPLSCYALIYNRTMETIQLLNERTYEWCWIPRKKNASDVACVK